MPAYKAKVWDGSEWVDLTSSITPFPDQSGNAGKVLVTDGTNTSWGFAGAVGGGTDQAFYENDTEITTDYTLTVGKNAGTFGPVLVADGATVSVPDGSTWVVV
jgi:hypothetical protein